MMPRQPSMTVLDPHSFAASTLADSEGLAAAVKALESCLARPDIPLDLIVQDLCSVPNLFEFVVSTWPSVDGLVRRILGAYPTDPAVIEASSASFLLRRLSSVLFALPPNLFSTEISCHIGRSKIYVEDAFPVLALLCSTDFSSINTIDRARTCVLEDLEYDDDEFSGFFVRSKKQKKSRRKNKDTAYAIAMAPFHRLGAKVPSDNVEASQVAGNINDELKKILKSYLEILLESSLAQQLKHAYVQTDDDVRVCSPALAQLEKAKAIEAVEPEPSTYSKIQPMKAALYFENADKFGEWRIIIGTDATKILRELANSDKKKCHDVVKKIKYLSKGRFSDENQTRLNESSGVPIFEAKVRPDLRLVYQIDVAPDYDGEVERQVIKIYCIHTHIQSNRIWDVMGQYLARKGEVYRRRCIFRTPVHAGSDICLPASFRPVSLQNDVSPVPLIFSNERMGELHSIIFEKYITFSQAFLNSLIANQDVQHVFELTPQELRIVECTTSCFVLGRSGTGKTTTMLFKMLGIQRAWEMQMSDMPKPRQIFVTKSRVLATKVQEYFAGLLESLALAEYSLEDLKKMRAQSTESGLVDADDEDQFGIPRKYSALGDSHFPLFVTFNQLARMISADILSGGDPEVQRFFTDTDEIRTQDSLVTYDSFTRNYWPHFPQPLTKGLEPWLVFSEFMGIIKGSEKSLSCPGGFLDEGAYCSLPARSNPTFADQRQTVYAIFQAYCKLKKERRHHDIADRTHAILKMLMGGSPLKGQKIDYLYVDEAQDNLLVDALLLRLICRNPDGLFWAGDTAQTISAGSSFRFDDLKAFLYRIERTQSTHLIQDQSIADPMVFQLAINYRSHGGIVNCAQSVIERITHFWPDAIDSLRPEQGIVDGLKPWFFRGSNQNTVQFEQFLCAESGSRIELGARQCILVRNEEAVKKLRKEVGEIGLIMTLYDSKGLEFNDVLLYNFFEDSAVDVLRWRVLLDHLEEVGGRSLAKIYAPSFARDEGRFTGVCSELKLLYVGITRARNNLWIFDKSDKSEPMRMIWTLRNQIQNYTPGMDVPRLAVSSTPTEWESFGRELFKHKKYTQAMHCFDRASLPRMVAICEAFHFREVARAKVGVAPLEAQQDAFLIAADAFAANGNDSPPGKDKLQYYRNAAGCYVRAGDDRKAAVAYLDAQEYESAARRFRKARLFDKILEVLHNHSQKIPSKSLEELYTACRLFYYSKDDPIRSHLPLFKSFEEELQFLKGHNLSFARATLLESHGKYLEAAELHLSENRPLNAISDLLRERNSHDAIKQANKLILGGLWRRCSFGIASKEVAADHDVGKLLELASELSVDLVDPLDRHEISMFRAIAQADLPSLKKLARIFLKEERTATALLALDHFFSHLPLVKSYTLQEMSMFLGEFRQYTRLLYYVVSHPDPLRLTPIKRLFCITEISNTQYRIEPGSFLHCSATGDCYGLYPQPPIVSLSERKMVTALRKYLTAHLCKRVTEENELCYSAVVFSQCLTFIVNGQCNRVSCPQEHVKSTDLDSKRYNLRIGIHLQQICILQLMYSVNKCTDRQSCVLDWLIRLYEAFHPQSHVQGSIADLELSMISGSQEGLDVMKEWVQDALDTLRANYDRSAFLTNVLKLTSLIFVFDGSNALRCITQAPFNVHQAKVQEFVYPDGRYVLEDAVRLFDGTRQTSISAGLLFLRHVLKSGLFVDLSVFCDCLEKVVGKISISWRLSSLLPLDGLVLPRGWLGSHKDISSRKDTNIVLIEDVLNYVRDLLIFLQSDGASHLQGKFYLSHARLTPMLCNVFTARICRALCLLYYNVRNFRVRDKVQGIFDALQTAGVTHRLYRKYVQARSNEYLKVVIEYDADAKVVIEDLVQLLHKERDLQRVPPLRLPRIQHILFADPSEIPSLLASQRMAAYSNRAENKENTQPEEPEVSVEEEFQELPSASNEFLLSREYEPTSEDVSAAEKIKAVYRMYRKHRESQTRAVGKGLKAQRNIVFLTCIKNVYAFRWGRSPYRTIYLWALPHLVVCLDNAISIVHEFKNETKGRLLEGSHGHLEEIGKQMSTINAMLKDGHNLRKMIEPNAAMHQAKDKDKMKQAVLNVKDFIHRLPSPTLSPEIQEDLRIAYELVVAEKPLVPKLEKPTLNTEDV